MSSRQATCPLGRRVVAREAEAKAAAARIVKLMATDKAVEKKPGGS
jgi:hypothetical protein